MNKGRRKQIAAALETIGGLIGTMEQASSDIDGLESEIELIRDDESEYHENLPENMKDGDKGSTAEEALSNLDDAVSEITNAKDRFEGILEKLGEAKDELEAMQGELESASGSAESAQ